MTDGISVDNLEKHAQMISSAKSGNATAAAFLRNKLEGWAQTMPLELLINCSMLIWLHRWNEVREDERTESRE